MRRINLARAALAPAAAVAALAIGTGTAFAHPAPFDVSAGSASSGEEVHVSGVSGTVTFKDTTTNVTLTCDTATVPADVTVGNGQSGTHLVPLDGTNSKWTDCTGPAGLKFDVAGYGTWYLNVDDVTSGVATGTVTNIRAHVQSTQGPTCGFDVGDNAGSFTSSGTSTVDPGTVDATYTNSSQALDVPASNPGSLGLWNVDDGLGHPYCITAAILGQGDAASFSATFTVNADDPANDPVAIN